MPPPFHCAMFVTGGEGLPHFHFRHRGSRHDGDETLAVWKGSTEITVGTARGMHCQEGTDLEGEQEKDRW